MTSASAPTRFRPEVRTRRSRTPRTRSTSFVPAVPFSAGRRATSRSGRAGRLRGRRRGASVRTGRGGSRRDRQLRPGRGLGGLSYGSRGQPERDRRPGLLHRLPPQGDRAGGQRVRDPQNPERFTQGRGRPPPDEDQDQQGRAGRRQHRIAEPRGHSRPDPGRPGRAGAEQDDDPVADARHAHRLQQLRRDLPDGVHGRLDRVRSGQRVDHRGAEQLPRGQRRNADDDERLPAKSGRRLPQSAAMTCSAAASAASSCSATRSRPRSQKPGSARSTPTIRPSSSGEREPPQASISR